MIVPRLALCLIALVLAAAGALAVPPEAAQARVGSCLAPGFTAPCTVWYGKVTFVGDGDTIYVDVNGDRSSKSYSVRMTGLNATEQYVYTSNPKARRGECHSLEATARLESLIRRSRNKVRLAAMDPASHSRNRMRRSVAVKLRGRWRDVSRILVSEGHALWLPNANEWAWNAGYSTLAERAAAAQRGIWSPTYCGLGPSDASPLRVLVNADADGDDHDFINGEWIRIRNLDTVNEVHLGGWWVRDSALRRYTFPEWATLPPGETLTVYAGDGTDTWTEFFWDQKGPVFENPKLTGEKIMGDGAYLFDPQGDLRAWMQYPCREACTDQYAGAVKVTAKPQGREHVTVRNVASFAIDLDGYRLQSPPYTYAFPRDSVLQPGEAMEIEVLGDPAEDSRLQKHWGEVGPILNNGGDRVKLTSFREVVLDCYSFGNASC
jgi:endonuclease YncB( thermonuclease family)